MTDQETLNAGTAATLEEGSPQKSDKLELSSTMTEEETEDHSSGATELNLENEHKADKEHTADDENKADGKTTANEEIKTEDENKADDDNDKADNENKAEIQQEQELISQETTEKVRDEEPPSDYAPVFWGDDDDAKPADPSQATTTMSPKATTDNDRNAVLSPKSAAIRDGVPPMDYAPVFWGDEDDAQPLSPSTAAKKKVEYDREDEESLEDVAELAAAAAASIENSPMKQGGGSSSSKLKAGFQSASRVTRNSINSSFTLGKNVVTGAVGVTSSGLIKGTQLGKTVVTGAVGATSSGLIKGTQLVTDTAKGAANVTGSTLKKGTQLVTDTAKGAATVTGSTLKKGTQLVTGATTTSLTVGSQVVVGAATMTGSTLLKGTQVITGATGKLFKSGKKAEDAEEEGGSNHSGNENVSDAAARALDVDTAALALEGAEGKMDGESASNDSSGHGSAKGGGSGSGSGEPSQEKLKRRPSIKGQFENLTSSLAHAGSAGIQTTKQGFTKVSNAGMQSVRMVSDTVTGAVGTVTGAVGTVAGNSWKRGSGKERDGSEDATTMSEGDSVSNAAGAGKNSDDGATNEGTHTEPAQSNRSYLTSKLVTPVKSATNAGVRLTKTSIKKVSGMLPPLVPPKGMMSGCMGDDSAVVTDNGSPSHQQQQQHQQHAEEEEESAGQFVGHETVAIASKTDEIPAVAESHPHLAGVSAADGIVTAPTTTAAQAETTLEKQGDTSSKE